MRQYPAPLEFPRRRFCFSDHLLTLPGPVRFSPFGGGAVPCMSSKMALAREFVLRHRPEIERNEINRMELARRLMIESPGMFKTVEYARSYVRKALGTNNASGATPAFIAKSTIADGLAAIPTQARPTEPLDITSPGRYGIISDVHFPYHDEAALLTALEWLLQSGITRLYCNGDMIDCYQLSRFVRDPRKGSIGEELGNMAAFFDLVSKHFEKVWWKLGNHEQRLDTYLMTKAPELLGLPGMDLFSLVCRIGERDYPVTVVESERLTRMGRLNVLHGHEFGGAGGFPSVNPARGLFLRSKASTICGHHHQTSEHAESNINGDAIGCWSTGCLCDLRPSYSPFAFAKWNHGFAVVDLEADGRFTVRNVRIIDGVCR